MTATQFSSTAIPLELAVGTGSTIVHNLCSTILQNTTKEVIFATCFWAKSESSKSLSGLLRDLSKKALSNGSSTKISVRICVSSLSVWQKLLHTSATEGQIIDASTWSRKLKLPTQDEIPGLDLQVKSVFIKPFSVIHSKYVIIDRHIAAFPSCNVSFETWFEGALVIQGPLVQQLFDFWMSFWVPGGCSFAVPDFSTASGNAQASSLDKGCNMRTISTDHSGLYYHSLSVSSTPVEASLLPSQHHRNPRFRLIPWKVPAEPPRTPLNQFTLQCLRAATTSIYFQTPNMTCKPVIQEILQAILRGVNVHVVTNDRLMMLEQVLTAGTTTRRASNKLVRSYEKIKKSAKLREVRGSEEGQNKIGTLKIAYFKSVSSCGGLINQPVKSHIKLTIIDEEITILGSGNMDRASWFTSQELGIAFRSTAVSEAIHQYALQYVQIK